MSAFDEDFEQSAATKVEEWAKSMNFEQSTNSPMPSTKDFEYLCRGTMKDILLYIVEHVQPVKTARKIRGNVLLEHQFRQTVNPMTSGKTALNTEQAKVDENAIKEDREKILVAERKKRNLMESLQMTLEKIQILEALANNAEIRATTMKAQKKTLKLYFNDCNQRASQCDVDKVHDPILEATCMKNIRDTCNKHAEILAKSVVDDRQLTQVEREYLTEGFRKAVNDILLENKSVTVLRCLTEISAKKPVDETSTSTEVNFDEPPSDVPVGLPRIETFAQTISLETSMLKLKRELDGVITEIDKKLMDLVTEANFDMAKKEIKQRLKEAELMAEWTFIKKQANQLEVELQTITERRKEVEKDFRLMEAEERNMQRLQEVVKISLEELHTRRSTFDELRSKLSELLESTFSDAKLESVTEALRLFHDRTSLKESAILSDVPRCDQYRTAIPDPLETLKMKEAVRRMHLLLSSTDSALASMSGENPSNELKELAKAMMTKMNEKLEVLLPKIRDFSEESTKMVAKSEGVIETVRDWWELPAQKFELGVEVEGATLSTWMSRLEQTSATGALDQ